MTFAINNTHVRSSCQPKRITLTMRISQFLALAHQRRQLAALDAHMLSDIGVTQAQAIAESRKLPWNAPNHWQE